MLKGELRHHQLQGVRWLISLYCSGLSGILSDELEHDRRVSAQESDASFDANGARLMATHDSFRRIS